MEGNRGVERTQIVIPRRVQRRKPKLPVVQVTPFLREREDTWYKDKSLPEFYEKPDVVANSTDAFIKPPPTAFSTHSDSMLLTSRENRPILPLAQSNMPNTVEGIAQPPKTSLGTTRLQEVLVASPKAEYSVRGRRLVLPASPRSECISPEHAIKSLPKHGFAPTIVDRERKTVEESPTIKPTSLLNRERTQEFVTKQQRLRLRGLRVRDGHIAPATSNYGLNRGGGVQTRSLEEFYRQLVTSYNRGYAFSPTKSRLARFEPSPDSITEPLISVNNENVTHRLSDCVNQDEAKSAFRILQTAGKPTYIEKTLERDYSILCSTTKRGSSNAGHHFTRFLKLKNYNPTQGELFIMVNREQNRAGNWTATRNQSVTQFSDNQSWYLRADDRDIPVSPDMTSHEYERLVSGRVRQDGLPEKPTPTPTLPALPSNETGEPRAEQEAIVLEAERTTPVTGANNEEFIGEKTPTREEEVGVTSEDNAPFNDSASSIYGGHDEGTTPVEATPVPFSSPSHEIVKPLAESSAKSRKHEQPTLAPSRITINTILPDINANV